MAGTGRGGSPARPAGRLTEGVLAPAGNSRRWPTPAPVAADVAVAAVAASVVPGPSSRSGVPVRTGTASGESGNRRSPQAPTALAAWCRRRWHPGADRLDSGRRRGADPAGGPAPAGIDGPACVRRRWTALATARPGRSAPAPMGRAARQQPRTAAPSSMRGRPGSTNDRDSNPNDCDSNPNDCHSNPNDCDSNLNY